VLLPKKPDAVDDLLSPRTRGVEAGGEAGVLALQELHALGRDHSLDSSGFEALEPRLGLKGATPERSQLVTEMLDQLLQLRKGSYLRPYAV
jgi:hypothetical protein